MLKRELKLNFKSFLIWTSILLIIFLAIFLVYPSIIDSENITMMEEMMKIFPEEVLKAFNMDISTLDTAYGWFKSEGFIFILLITGVYSSLLGSTILLKEENDKTIEYLNTLPIKRRNIVLDKVICGIIYIVSMILIIGIFNYIGLEISGDFDKKQFILLSITPLFSSLPLFGITLLISTFLRKTKSAIGISIGLSFISYFLQIVSEISDITEPFKYLTPFTLADVRNVILESTINSIMIIISIILTLTFIAGTFIKYENKELI